MKTFSLCGSTALSLPPFRKPVVPKTVLRTVFAHPSNPFQSKQKSRALHDLFVLASIRDLILRCPLFCSASLVAPPQKIDRCNSANSLYPPPAALVGFPRRLPLGFKSFRQQIKRTINDGSFYLAEKEGFEPSRQLPDLHP